MSVTTWNETFIDGKRYLVIEVAQLRIPLDWDPSSNVFIAIAAPTGGLLNYPALVRGDDGSTPDIDTVINFTAMPWDSTDDEYASFTKINDTLYQLNLGLKRGAPGTDGDTVLNPADFDDVVPGKMIVANSDGTSFVMAWQKVGDWYYPATVNDIPTGNPNFTICQVPVPAQNFAWRPDVDGQQLLQGTGVDVAVDIVARLGGTSGNIVGRAIGQAGQFPATHVISGGAPWALRLTNDYDLVGAGEAVVIYFRAERRTGTETFSGSKSNGTYRVKVDPVP